MPESPTGHSPRLPTLTPARRLFRKSMRLFSRILVRALVRLEVEGREHFPASGPLLAVSNHLADADFVVGLSIAPWEPEILGKAALRRVPIVGALLQAYGTIWVEPFSADRAALHAALAALRQGRVLAIAPEGRESRTGALEAGTSGAAFLALRAGAPLLPVGIAGTEDVLPALRRLRRARVQMQIGPSFRLESTGDRRADLQRGTETIMRTLAALLPKDYRGIYAHVQAGADG